MLQRYNSFAVRVMSLFLPVILAFVSPVFAQPGNAIQFTKASLQHGATPSGTALNSSQFTVEFWVKMPTTAGWDGVVDNGYQVVSGSHGWYVANGNYATADASFLVAGIRNSGAVKEIYLPIGTTDWTHVSFTFDGTTLRGYKNGVFSLSVDLNGGASYNPTSTKPLFFGTRGVWNGSSWTPDPAYYMDNLVDELRIFNTALSAQTISRRYMAPMSAEHPNNANLIGHWKFDEASGTSASEVGGSGLTFTYANAPGRVASEARMFAAGISSISPSFGHAGTTVQVASWGGLTSGAFFGNVKAGSASHLGNGEMQITVPEQAGTGRITLFGSNAAHAFALPFTKTLPGTIQTINGSFFTAGTSDISSLNSMMEMVTADVDGDGKPDLTYRIQGSPDVIHIRRNTSTGGTLSLASASTVTVGQFGTPHIFSDINADGLLDLVRYDYNGSNYGLSVYLNQTTGGTISFGARQFTGAGNNTQLIRAGDIDGDGKQDIVVGTNTGTSRLIFLRNTGSGSTVSFSVTNTVLTSTILTDFELADVTGDRLPEVIALRYVYSGAENGASAIRIFRNASTPANFAFSEASYTDFTGLNEPNSISAADIDGDGKLDFLVSQNGSAAARWYRNTTTNDTLKFVSGVMGVSNYNARRALLEDFNGDGKPDAVVAMSYQFEVSENTSTQGSISFGSYTAMGGSQNSVTYPITGDFNADGKTDIIASYASGNWGWRFYENAATVPGFTISSTTVAKGSVNFGTARDSVLVTNSGSATLTISNIVSSHASLIPDFSSTTVSAGGTKYIPFTQIYGSTGAQSNTLTISHNGPGSTSVVTVTYTGTQAVAANAGSRVVLDGTNDYLIRTGVFSTARDNIALEGWFNATSVTGSNRFLMYNGHTNSSGYGLFLNTSGEIRALLGGITVLTSGITMPVNEWMHLVLTRESGTWKLYVDGELKTLSSNTSAPITPSGSIIIGANPSGGERFAGSIDEVRLWTTARTQTQIRQSYASRVGNDSGLAAYYRFDQSSSVYVADYSGNGNHLTATNGPVFSSSTAPVGTEGVISASINPYNVAFGNRVVGQPATIMVTLGNTGSGILHYGIGGATVAPFSKSATDVGVKAGASKTVTYTYIPTDATTSSTGLSYSSQTGTATFPTISGTGVLTAPTTAGNALSFDGTNDFVEILDATDPTAYTIEAWVKFNNVTGSKSIFTRTSASGPAVHYSHSLLLNSSGKIVHYAYFDQLTSATVTGTTTIEVGKWYHIAGTATNAGMMRLYVNGVEEGTAQAVQTLWTAGDRWNIGQVSISNSWFNGELDEVRLWSVARTQSEIQSSYAPVAGNSTNLSRIWRFDEISGTTVYDGTTNNIQGTNSGATIVTSTAPVAAPTVTLSAFAFGNTEAGTSPQLIRYLKNPTGGVAHVTLSENGTYYSMTPASATVPKGDSVAVTTTFSPVAAGAQNATLSIAGNATGSAMLSGTGVVSENNTAGNALVLDGNRYGTVPRMISDDFTIEFFVKTTQSAGASTGNWYSGQGIVDAEVGGFNNDFGISMGNGKILFGTGNTDLSVRSKWKINDGLWHHVAATRNRTTGKMVLFIDGLPHDSAVGNTAALTASANISIGRLQTGINPFIGTLDELRIWNTAKTGTQIRSLVHKTVGGTSSGLVGYFRFDAASGNNVQNLVNASSVLAMNAVAFETPTTSPLLGGYPLLSANALAFSNREVGATAQLQATLTNYGSTLPAGAITISSITSTNPAFSGTASVSSIAASGTSVITVNFNPSAVISYADTIRIFHSGIGSVLVLPVTGSGSQADFAAGASISFGTKRFGSTYSDSVQIQNTGGWGLSISNATISGSGYTIPATTATIPAGDSGYFKVNFAPTAVQSYPAWLILTHNGATSPDSVQLSGSGAQGELSIVTSSISFGTVNNGATKTDSVQVNSTGGVSVTISGISSTNARFSSASTGEISASDSKWIKVTFAPNAFGAQNGAIVLTHNGPTSPDTILVSGTGTYPAATSSGNSFSGASNTYINVPYTAGLNPTSELTFEIWARPTTYSYQHQTPMTSRGTFTGYQFYLNPINDGNSNKWTATVGNGSTWVTVVGSTAVLNTWTHLAGVVENDTLYFYINGSLAGKTFAEYQPNTTNPFRMSSLSESVNFIFFGQLDEARVWSEAKSPAEIQTLMTTSQAGSAPGLEGYWRFDESTGYTITDYSPHGRNGSKNVYWTATYTISTTESAPLFRPYFLTGSSTIDFGRVSVGDDSTRSFNYQNIGGGTAAFGTPSASNDLFAATTVPASVVPFGTGTFGFTFTPDDIGAETGNIVLNYTSNGNAGQVTLPVSGIGNRTEFVAQTHALENVTSRSVQLVDFDNDGDLDVHLTGYNSSYANVAKVFKNDGSAAFSNPVNTGNGYSPAYWADLDNDGDLDAIQAGFGQAISRNNGDGSFTSNMYYSQFNSIPNAYGLRVFDVDNDGLSDILIESTYPDRNLQVFKNTGNLTFSHVQTVDLENNEAYYEVIDWEGDGWNDIIVSEYGGSGISARLLKNVKGTFTSKTIANLLGVRNGSVSVADFDNDGRPDVMMTGYNDWQGGDLRKIFRNVNDSTAQLLVDFPSPVSNARSTIADFDADGNLDVVIAGNGSGNIYSMSLFKQKNGNWVESQFIGNLASHVAAVGDVNNDGKPDLLSSGFSQYNNGYSMQTRFDLNTGSVANTAPGVPSNLSATFDGENVTFTWDAASDAEGGPLTYNIRIGTSTGGIQIVSPNSFADGKRKIAAAGNTGYRRSFVLAGVELNKTFYWSVQAVDAGNRGGAFASETTFTNTVEATLGGNTPGWRFVTSPAPGTTFAELLDGIWTQGATGADVTSGSTNVYQYNQNTAQWSGVTDLTQTMQMGRGYAVYVYNLNTFGDAESAVWPKVLKSNRKPSLSNTAIPISYTTGVTNAGFNLVGNPFPFAIDIENTGGFERENVDAVHYVWRAEIGSYAYYVAGAQLSGNGGSRYIAPYQGFWKKANNETTAFTFKRAARFAGASTFQKQSSDGSLKLSVSNGKQSDETLVRISGSPLGFEVVQMDALSPEFAFVYSLSETGKKLDLMEINPLKNRHEIPVQITASATDSLVVTWPELVNVPQSWDVMLVSKDRKTVLNLKEMHRWIWKNTSLAKGVSPNDSTVFDLTKLKAATSIELEFTLLMGEGVATSLEESLAGIPTELTLSQNYPNPFNPQTTIAFGIPSAGNVQLQVFDITGRKVAELLNEQRTAGWHKVSFDAQKLTSGVYFYRIQTGKTVQTRKMTLLK